MIRGALLRVTEDAEIDTSSGRISVAVGKRIRAQRRARSLTAKELGKLTNLGGDVITRYERGERVISIGRLFFIAHALGVPIGHFFNGIAAEARVSMEVVATAQETAEEAADLALHLAKLATQIENPRSRALLLMLLEQLPGGQLVARATGVPRQKRRAKWYSKVDEQLL